MWTAAILAGGQARRLGGIDKSRLVIGGRSILERQIAVLTELTASLLIVTGEPLPVDIPQATVVHDRIGGAGALGGIYTALLEASHEQVLVIGCDMPFLDGPFLTYLMEQGKNADAAIPRDGRGHHPLCASYSRRIAGHLAARIDRGELSVRDALRGVAMRELGPDELAPFDPAGRLLININTPEDYARACRAADHEGPHRTHPRPATA
jgi:molybdopterin-guanine dinucleotide biosynthesis protein A